MTIFKVCLIKTFSHSKLNELKEKEKKKPNKSMRGKEKVIWDATKVNKFGQVSN